MKEELEDLVRRLWERVEKLERASDPPKPAEPEGVWVRPGDLVFTLDRKPRIVSTSPDGVFRVWFAVGYDVISAGASDPSGYTYKGRPVLGYEEDKT